MRTAISGVFHITEAECVRDILSKGLMPGKMVREASGQRRGGRTDVHLTAFSPFEADRGFGRATVLQNRIYHARLENKVIAQVSLNVDRVWDSLRICLANGYLLCDKVLPPMTIDSIVLWKWDAQAQRWRGEFIFEHRLETARIRAFDGSGRYNQAVILRVLSLTGRTTSEREKRI